MNRLQKQGDRADAKSNALALKSEDELKREFQIRMRDKLDAIMADRAIELDLEDATPEYFRKNLSKYLKKMQTIKIGGLTYYIRRNVSNSGNSIIIEFENVDLRRTRDPAVKKKYESYPQSIIVTLQINNDMQLKIRSVDFK